MNLVRLSYEENASVIDPWLVSVGEVSAQYHRGVNLGCVASSLILSEGKALSGGYASVNRNAAKGYASREAMASGFPDLVVPHQSPDMHILRASGYTGNGVFPAIVLGINSEDALIPDRVNDMYQRSPSPVTHERILPSIGIYQLDEASRVFIEEYFEL